MKMQYATSLLIAAFLFAACGGGDDDRRPDRRPVEAFQVDPATAASANLTIAFEGTPPEPQRVNMAADRSCLELHDGAVYTRTVVVNDNGTLANVFVYVKEGLENKSFPVPEESVLLDQDGCWYYPHVFGLQVGQTLVIRNSDPTLHNVHAVARANREFNIGQPVQGMETTRTFNQVEVMIPFKCDVHPWMSAYAGVLPHPYFGVSDESGAVTLASLPPGEYVIAAWHEEYGEQTQHVTLDEGETVDLSFTFSSGPAS
jgi:plastocyanin